MPHDQEILWTTALVRRNLLRRCLTLPPRDILASEIERVLRAFGARKFRDLSPEALAAAATPGLIARAAEFADPNVILFEVREWHSEERGRALAQLPYRNFLKTWYWLALSSHVAVSAGACELCGCKLAEAVVSGGIEVHHRHYRSRGFEVRDLDCLSLLCDSCHGAVHNKPRAGGPRTLQQILGATILRLAQVCNAG